MAKVVLSNRGGGLKQQTPDERQMAGEIGLLSILLIFSLFAVLLWWMLRARKPM